MGEYAEEAIQLGLCENNSSPAYKTSSNYNNDVWEDVSGKNRLISEMNSLHLCFIINYLLASSKNLRGNRLERMCYTLQNRLYLKENFQKDLNELLTGSYRMYPKEDEMVEDYYRKLLNKYPKYNWGYLEQIMYWC